MIFQTSLEETRQLILRSDLTLDLLRICSRSPQTLRQLVHTPSYPGIDAHVHSMRTELSITAAVSDARHHGLVTRVDLVEDPIYPRMHAERLRTTLLAFLACPRLGRLESAAYAAYIAGWFALPSVRRTPHENQDAVRALFLAFPELARRGFYAEAAGEEADTAGRVFGWYQLKDIPTRPPRVSVTRVLADLDRPALPAGRRALADLSTGDRPTRGFAARLLARRLEDPPEEPDTRIEIVPPTEPALNLGRLRPIPRIRTGSLRG